MKQTHLFIAKGFALVWVWMFAQPALAEFLTFGGIQKDDMNDPGQHDWIAAVALSPDNRHAYAAGYGRSGVLVFKSDTQTGKLAFMEAYSNGRHGVQGLFSPRFLVTSADGRNIYVSGKSNNLILALLFLWVGADTPADPIIPPTAAIPTYDYNKLVRLFDYDSKAPLDFQIESTADKDGIKVQEISYISPKGGRVTAYLLLPPGKGAFAGVIFLHRFDLNKDQFLDEALELAQKGVVCLLLDLPNKRQGYRPAYEYWLTKNPMFLQTALDVRRAVDLLGLRTDVDQNRLALVGHLYGAMIGGLLAGVEKRWQACVLMSGHPWLSLEKSWGFGNLDPRFNTIHYIGHAGPTRLFFQFGKPNAYIPEEAALKLYQAASEPKTIAWYDDIEHRLEKQARLDRLQWLCMQLGLKSAADKPQLLTRLHWFGNSCFRLDGSAVIYFDPGVTLPEEAPKADIILVSHSHGDHIFMPSVKRILKPETVILSTGFLKDQAKEYGLSEQVRAVRPGETIQIETIKIETVPAYNIGDDKPWHKKEYGHLGFIVTSQGESIYHAGDTDRIPEMAQIRCDVALLPIGGTYTMNVQEAAQAAGDIKPKVVIPMHARNEADYEQFRQTCGCTVVLMKKE